MANPGDNDSTTRVQGDQGDQDKMAEEEGGDDQAQDDQDDQDKVAARAQDARVNYDDVAGGGSCFPVRFSTSA